MTADFLRGFDDLYAEVSAVELACQGSIPDWLSGTLLRNGPARFRIGERSYNHWFDGLAMLHRFTFEQGRIEYGNRFLGSRNYRKVQHRKRMVYDQFATNPPRGLLARLAATLYYPLQFGNNDLVSIGRLGGQVAALGETPTQLAVDPLTLAMTGRIKFRDGILGMVTTAHPHHDAHRGAQFNYTSFVFPGVSSYKVYALADGSLKRRLLARLPVDEPCYMHSFGASADHLILTEFPLCLRPSRMVLNSLTGIPFIANFRWRPERGTRIRVIDKDSGEVTGCFQAPPFFAFHHINAWREGDELVADIAAYADDEVIRQTYFSHLRGPDGMTLSRSQIRRLRIPVSGEGRVDLGEPISAPAFEMPQIHPDRSGRNYRYAWGYGFEQPGRFNDRLLKVDNARPEPDTNFTVWHAAGCYPGEPIFVPRPGAGAEDDGVLLSLVLDAAAPRSFLLILDAASMRELGRAALPHRVPYGLHGAWLPQGGGE